MGNILGTLRETGPACKDTASPHTLTVLRNKFFKLGVDLHTFIRMKSGRRREAQVNRIEQLK